MGVYYQSQDDMLLLKSSRDHGMSLKSKPNSIKVNNSGPLPATDSWNFGTLIYETFNGAFTNSEQLNTKGTIPQVPLLIERVDSLGYLHCLQTSLEPLSKTTSLCL